MKRFFERLPTVWKYDSTFRIFVYLLGAAWFLSLIVITQTILYPSLAAGFLSGFFTTYTVLCTIRLIKEM